MAYIKTQWENRNPQVPINDANLNKIEEGIRTAHVTADQAIVDIGTINGTLSAHQNEIDALWTDSTAQQAQIDFLNSQPDVLEWRNITLAAQANPLVVNDVDNVFMQATDGTTSIILPAIPDARSQIRIVDAGQDFTARPCIIQRNGKKIMGLLDNLELNQTNTSVMLAWSGDTYGWVVVNTNY